MKITTSVSINGLHRIFTAMLENDTLIELKVVVRFPPRYSMILLIDCLQCGSPCLLPEKTISIFDKNIVCAFLTQNRTLQSFEINLYRYVCEFFHLRTHK